MTAKRWPATLAEFRELEAKAIAKYQPLVDALSPADLTGLAHVVGGALAIMKTEAYGEDVRRALGSLAGTRVGR